MDTRRGVRGAGTYRRMIRPKPVLRRMTYADHHAKPPDPEPGGQLEVPTVGVNSHAQLMARPSGLPLASEPIIGDTVRPAGDVMQKCDARNASTEGVGIELYEPNEFDNGMEEDHAEDLFGDFGRKARSQQRAHTHGV